MVDLPGHASAERICDPRLKCEIGDRASIPSYRSRRSPTHAHSAIGEFVSVLFAVPAILLLCPITIAASRAADHKAITAPSGDIANGHPVDSALVRISGTYSSSVGSDNRVHITVTPMGLTHVRFISGVPGGAGYWESVGFFDGQTYAGVLRRTYEDPSRAAKVSGTLRFSMLPDSRIEADVDIGGFGVIGSKRQETWSRAEKTSSLIPRLPDTDWPILPKFGEYVYVDELPEAVRKVSPYYPEDARARGIEGTVLVQALIGTDGKVRDMRIVKSIPELDRVAAACVWLWQFKPAMAKDKPVAVWVAIPVKFTLVD